MKRKTKEIIYSIILAISIVGLTIIVSILGIMQLDNTFSLGLAYNYSESSDNSLLVKSINNYDSTTSFFIIVMAVSFFIILLGALLTLFEIKKKKKK